MKVLIVSAGIVSDRRPHGEALIAQNVISRLAQRGHELTVFCTDADTQIDGVEFVKISAHAPGAALSRLAFARRAVRAAAQRPADVHHLLLPLTTDDGYTLVRGAPLVVGPLMLPWPAADGGAKPRNRIVSAAVRTALGRHEAKLHDATLRHASRLLVTGGPARNVLPAELHARCIEAPYGVDTKRFVATRLPDDPTILFFSVLLPRKGIETLLQAFPGVLRHCPAARLLIAGSDPRRMRPSLEARAHDLGIADAIEWVGAVAPADAPALQQRARVFCQPSDGEPFGMTILEAMASARPVVATSAGGVPGFVRDGINGRLVPPRDPALLADGLTSMLIRRGDAGRIAERNRIDAVERFDWERVVDRIEQAYREALEDRDVRLAV